MVNPNKTEIEILNKYGFKFESGEFTHLVGHHIIKTNLNEYCGEFIYPKGSGFTGLSLPSISFEKLLDTISKFKRYYV